MCQCAMEVLDASLPIHDEYRIRNGYALNFVLPCPCFSPKISCELADLHIMSKTTQGSPRILSNNIPRIRRRCILPQTTLLLESLTRRITLSIIISFRFLPCLAAFVKRVSISVSLLRERGLKMWLKDLGLDYRRVAFVSLLALYSQC